MPDSFTKFKEDPQKKEPVLSDGVTDDSDNGGLGAPVDGVTYSTPPTTLAYSTPTIIADKSTAERTITIDTAFMRALDGGEIRSGEISFSLLSAKDKFGNTITDAKLPDGIDLNPSNGNLTGVANAFIDKNVYTIRGTHITGVKRDTNVTISIATLPTAVRYPQYLAENPSPPPVSGCTHIPNLVKLIIEVDDVSDFSKCQLVTSDKGAHGFISSVDPTNNILFVDMASTSSDLYFSAGDKLDSEAAPSSGSTGFGYFFEKAKISKITYSFLSSKNIVGFTPQVSPEITDVSELNSLRYSISPDITQYGLSFIKQASNAPGGTISGLATKSIPSTPFNITVKNINNKVLSAPINISAQAISEPKVLSEVNYAFEPEKKQIIRVQSLQDTLGQDLEIGDIVVQATSGSRGRITLIEADSAPSVAGFIHVDILKSLSGTYKIFDLNPLSSRFDRNFNEYPLSLGVSLVTEQIFGRRLVLNVADIRNFEVDGYVSNDRGTIAKVKDIVSTSTQSTSNSGVIIDRAIPGKLYVDIENGSKGLFKNGDLIDNAEIYVIAIDTISGNVENALQTNVPFSFSPIVEPEITDQEFNSITWEVSPSLPNGPSCLGISGSLLDHHSKSDCIAVGSWLSSCSIPERTSRIDCENPGKWNSGPYFDNNTGVFYGLEAENDFPPQAFTVKATNVSGIVKETQITLSSNSPPRGLNYSSNVLIKLDNDGAIFNEKDEIASKGGAVGIIEREKFVFNNETYLFVRIREGEFKVGEDLDNNSKFFSQKSRIVWVSPVSMVLKYANIGPFGSGNYVENNIVSIGNCFNASGTNINRASEYDCIVNASGRFESNAEAQVILNDTTNNLIYLRHFFGTFATGMTFGRKSTDAQISTINQVISPNVMVTTSSPPGSDFAVGQNFSIGKVPPVCNTSCNSDPDDATGTVQLVNSPNNQILLSVAPASGYVKVAEPPNITQRRVYRSNPINSPGKNINSTNEYREINQVQFENSFFILRGQKVRLKRSLQFSNESNLTFKISPPLPQGLKLDTNGDIILDEDEANPKPSNWTVYTVSASNPFGTSTYTFGLKVKDYFGLIENLEKKNLSGILHKSGRNFHREPCMVTQDQINLSNTAGGGTSKHKDILCIYDVGEGELNKAGLNLEINFGDNVCQLYRREGYAFFTYKYEKSNLTLSSASNLPYDDPRNVEMTGDYAFIQCVNQAGSPGVQYPSGQSPEGRCVGNYETASGNVSCDDGEVGVRTQRFSLKNFCLDTSGAAKSETTLESCQAAYGRCSNGTSVSRSNCEDNSGTCILGGQTDGSRLTRSACEGASGYWVPEFAWNSTHYYDPDNGCYPMDFSVSDSFACSDEVGSCSVADGDGNPLLTKSECEQNSGIWTSNGVWFEQGFCEKEPPVSGDNIACEGTPLNCITSPDQEHVKPNVYVGTLEEFKSITLAPSASNSSNVTLANFVGSFSAGNSCLNNNTYDYDIATWSDQPTIDDLSGNPSLGDNNPFAGGNPFYTYSCLDGSNNILARIHLVVREWNSKFSARDAIDLINPPSLMDAAGNDDFGQALDNYSDWNFYVQPNNTCSDPNINFPD